MLWLLILIERRASLTLLSPFLFLKNILSLFSLKKIQKVSKLFTNSMKMGFEKNVMKKKVQLVQRDVAVLWAPTE